MVQSKKIGSSSAQKRLCAGLCACVLMLLAGCAAMVPPPAKSTSKPVPVWPEATNTAMQNSYARFYYRYASQEMLVCDTREVVFPLDRLEEAFAIQQLIAGPSVEKEQSEGLFNLGVSARVETGDILVVTLSQSFLDKPASAPLGWENHAWWVNEVAVRRRLAVASIVNTVVEMGKYDQVQVLVADAGGVGRRLKAGELLVDAEDPDALLGPFSHDSSLVLTPQNAAYQFLRAWKERNWEALGLYVSALGVTGGFSAAAIGQNSFEDTVVLSDFSVDQAIVSSDGQTATVGVDVALYQSAGTSYKAFSYKTRVTLHQVDEVWLVDLESVRKLVGN